MGRWEKSMTQSHARTLRRLSELSSGESGIVALTKLPAEEENRLRDLGLHRGSDVKVLRTGSAQDGLLVGVGDGRIGMNAGTARKIFIY
jgi:Fe2+ transport system protein FeoA